MSEALTKPDSIEASLLRLSGVKSREKCGENGEKIYKLIDHIKSRSLKDCVMSSSLTIEGLVLFLKSRRFDGEWETLMREVVAILETSPGAVS